MSALPKELQYGVAIFIYAFIEVFVGWFFFRKSPTLALLRGVRDFFLGILYLIAHPKYLLGVLAFVAVGIWLLALVLGVRTNPAPAPVQATQPAQVVAVAQAQPEAAITQTAEVVQTQVASLAVMVTGGDLTVFTVLPETNDPAMWRVETILITLREGDQINVLGRTATKTFSQPTVGGITSADFIVVEHNSLRGYVFASRLTGGWTTNLGGLYEQLPLLP